MIYGKLPMSEGSSANSRFTSRFERAVMAWLHDSPISAVAENFNLSWDEVDGIMQRGVKRGLERRHERKPKNIGIDETSFRKGHDYVTVVVDKDGGYVIDVIFGHDAEVPIPVYSAQGL